ncbi:MAG: hypothetical protein ACI81O_001162, partial [Cyclobacteriaceae bacterium]
RINIKLLRFTVPEKAKNTDAEQQGDKNDTESLAEFAGEGLCLNVVRKFRFQAINSAHVRSTMDDEFDPMLTKNRERVCLDLCSGPWTSQQVAHGGVNA